RQETTPSSWHTSALFTRTVSAPVWTPCRCVTASDRPTPKPTTRRNPHDPHSSGSCSPGRGATKCAHSRTRQDAVPLGESPHTSYRDSIEEVWEDAGGMSCQVPVASPTGLAIDLLADDVGVTRVPCGLSDDRQDCPPQVTHLAVVVHRCGGI